MDEKTGTNKNKKCERSKLRPDDHRWWYICRRCQTTWSERIAGIGWRPATCPERDSEHQDAEMSYHPTLENGK